MERLTKRYKDHVAVVCDNCKEKDSHCDAFSCRAVIRDRLAEYEDAEEQGLLVWLPCKVGDAIYRIIDDCTLPGDCGTKRMCKGCEYRNLFIEEDAFHLCELTDSGKLRSGYYLTREEAEKALEDA